MMAACCRAALVCSPDQAHQRMLWRAAAEGDALGVVRALQMGADINAREPSSGNTPLMLAVAAGATAASAAGSSAAVAVLLERKPELELENEAGERALHIACIRGDVSAVGLLLSSRARVDAPHGRDGRPPLWLAMDRAMGEGTDAPDSVFVELLLDVGRANTELLVAGKTALLHVVEEGGSENLAQLLLERGAAVDGPRRRHATAAGLPPLLLVPGAPAAPRLAPEADTPLLAAVRGNRDLALIRDRKSVV